MKKADRKLLDESLSKALDPPRKKPRGNLDALLNEYDDQTRTEGVTPPNPTSRGVRWGDVGLPTAPARDFNKRANSLDRMALPAGIFPGSSKKLYDALYIRTRGAVVPKRSVRATKRELSDWSGIRNVKTIDSHLRYFSAIGLVISEWQRGQNEGCLYEVLLPEETSGLFVAREQGVAPPDPTLPPVTPPNGESPQILGSPPPQNLGSPHLTNVPELSTTYGDAKTYLKTKDQNTDDEAFAKLVARLKEATKEVTGKPSPPTDADRWKELGEVLIAELRIAAGRTNISSVPAFLAEHLRRRLWKIDKQQAQAEGRELPDQTR
ncbi:MAG TPA: hypothetical protein VF703_02785, partial [Pyrinomonadaceae bacterium]